MASVSEQATRAAPFALRVVRRQAGLAAIIYRRRVNDRMEERFDRVAALSPLAMTAASGLLRTAVKACNGQNKLEPGPYLPLDADWGARVAGFAIDVPVPLRSVDGRYYEDRLNGVQPSLVGRTLQGHSVREISDAEFGAIIVSGFAETLAPANAVRLGLMDPASDPEARVMVALPPEEQQRRIVQILTNKKIRDAAFRLKVLSAYGDTCAVTGTTMTNGEGRVEAQAAHIWSVEDGGPDVVQNGLALSATVHWLFDRHLISLTDDWRLLVAHDRIPASLQALFCGHLEMIRLPHDPKLYPHPGYITHHRERFVGNKTE